jgi:parallel beta-helix repeat protein
LQQLLDMAQPDAVLRVPACIYRESVTIAKPVTLDGSAGAEVRGSDVWREWSQQGGGWVSSNKVPSFWTAGECASESDGRCLWPEQVFLDGSPLRQVSDTPGDGQFALNGMRQVVLGTNPSGRTVEVTTRMHWVTARANNVTIQNFRMRHAATPRANGAIITRGYSSWTIQDNVLSDAHSSMIDISEGSNIKVLRNDLFAAGQMAIHGYSLTNMLLQGNKIHNNNTEAFRVDWEAGGLKITESRDLTFAGNEVYNNIGFGVWCDIDCINVTYSNNRVHHNTNAGLFFEISDGAKIYGNYVWENGWGSAIWGWGAGILISSSKNVEVYNNILAWNASGITVLSQDRGTGQWNTVVNNYVHENKIMKMDTAPYGLAWVQDWNGTMFAAAANNQGNRNMYWYSAAEGETRFAWGNRSITQLSEFNATPGEEGGSYLSTAEKDQILSAANIPLVAEQ